FRAIAVLCARDSAELPDGDVWRLQRSLFDRGLVCVGRLVVPGGEAPCFLASADVRAIRRLGGGARGHLTIASLAKTGRFANQLSQYAYAKLYALRHGATAAFPAGPGRTLYGLRDPSCVGLDLPRRDFAGFSEEDRRLWDMDDPPIDVDLWGYFQEI